jgi:hypothetical protein
MDLLALTKIRNSFSSASQWNEFDKMFSLFSPLDPSGNIRMAFDMSKKGDRSPIHPLNVVWCIHVDLEVQKQIVILTNEIKDYIEPPVKSTVRVKGYNGSTNSTMVGTVKWKIKDDKGKIHSFILPNTYYSPSVETRLLSPQNWAQTRKKGRDSYCITYHDAIIMRWNKDEYQITAPLDNRKHRNVGVVRSASGITQYLASCQAIDEEFTTLAYPAPYAWIAK